MDKIAKILLGSIYASLLLFSAINAIVDGELLIGLICCAVSISLTIFISRSFK